MAAREGERAATIPRGKVSLQGIRPEAIWKVVEEEKLALQRENVLQTVDEPESQL